MQKCEGPVLSLVFILELYQGYSLVSIHELMN